MPKAVNRVQSHYTQYQNQKPYNHFKAVRRQFPGGKITVLLEKPAMSDPNPLHQLSEIAQTYTYPKPDIIFTRLIWNAEPPFVPSVDTQRFIYQRVGQSTQQSSRSKTKRISFST